MSEHVSFILISIFEVFYIEYNMKYNWSVNNKISVVYGIFWHLYGFGYIILCFWKVYDGRILSGTVLFLFVAVNSVGYVRNL